MPPFSFLAGKKIRRNSAYQYIIGIYKDFIRFREGFYMFKKLKAKIKKSLHIPESHLTSDERNSGSGWIVREEERYDFTLWAKVPVKVLICPHCGYSVSTTHLRSDMSGLMTRYCPSCMKELIHDNNAVSTAESGNSNA